MALPRLILSLLVDDLGRADLGYTGSRIATPHLDLLRSQGLAFSSLYVLPVCTPTRSSFLSNRLPLALGLQGKDTVQQGCAWGLGLEEQTFVSALQGAGWNTHMVGKAHIGADYWRRTPTYRGFNSFFGYLYGAEDYYTHRLANAWDLRNDTAPNCGPGCSQAVGPMHNGTYSPYLFAPEVARHIAAAAASKAPTYIHFTPQSVHAPLEAPEEWVAPYRAIFGPQNPGRAIHAGALACLDAAIGNITAAISAAGLENDTLIFVSADNGGPMGDVGDGTMASNFPFRGGKHSLYEGGVNAASFIWGPRFLPSSNGGGGNKSWGGLVHISDVGVTLLEAAGVKPLPPKPGRAVHGVSFWAPLTQGAPASLRNEVVVNVDYTKPSQAAIVTSDGWKLLLGSPGDDSCNYWSGPDGEKVSPPPPPPFAAAEGSELDASLLLVTNSSSGPFWPLANMTPTLYNLNRDPRETTNVAAANPAVVARMLALLSPWGEQQIQVVENSTADPRADPKNFGGSWTPWLGV